MARSAPGKYQDTVLGDCQAEFFHRDDTSLPQLVLTSGARSLLGENWEPSSVFFTLESVCGLQPVLHRVVFTSQDDWSRSDFSRDRHAEMHVGVSGTFGYVAVAAGESAEQISFDVNNAYFLSLLQNNDQFKRLTVLGEGVLKQANFGSLVPQWGLRESDAERNMVYASYLTQTVFAQAMLLPLDHLVRQATGLKIMQFALEQQRLNSNIAHMLEQENVLQAIRDMNHFLEERLYAEDQATPLRMLAYFAPEKEWRELGKELEELDLSGELLTWKDLQFLSHLSQLKRLNLAWTAIGIDGAELLADLRSLESLSLANTNTTNTVIGHLEALHGLIELDISATYVSDPVVETLTRTPQLRKIDLRDTSVSSDAITRLQESLPDCVVVT